jgi:hypothetical protein
MLSKVPNVPLLTPRFAFKSGVRGAKDIIDNPNKKEIALSASISFLVRVFSENVFKAT